MAKSTSKKSPHLWPDASGAKGGAANHAGGGNPNLSYDAAKAGKGGAGGHSGNPQALRDKAAGTRGAG